MAVKKVNITVPDSLLERIEEYSKETGISRSSLMSVATAQYLDALQASPAINQILKTLAETLSGTADGTMSDDVAIQNISDIENSYVDIYGKKP